MSATPPAGPRTNPGITVLGLGAMGSVLATRLLDAGYPVTVWNRTSGRDTLLLERGAEGVATVTEAVARRPLIVACLLRHASVHETLDPVVGKLRGRTLVNVTTTTPNEARELAGWAAEHDLAYLDDAILAVPAMIGSREAQIFYSGSSTAYEQYRDVLDSWATTTYDGPDAGMASLIDPPCCPGCTRCSRASSTVPRWPGPKA
jgi:3-hydroxyisobutyrate dehydrogenase-like beta-hydroxyacid dehydrogenase